MTSTSGRSASTSAYWRSASISGSDRTTGMTTPAAAAASSSSPERHRPIASVTAARVSGTPSSSWERSRRLGYMFCGITKRPSAQRKNENPMTLPCSTLDATG